MTPRAVGLLGAGLLVLLLLALALFDWLRERHPRWPKRERKTLRGTRP